MDRFKLEKTSCPGIGGADDFTCSAYKECCKYANECCYKDPKHLLVFFGVFAILVAVVVIFKKLTGKKKHATAMIHDVEKACDQIVNVDDKTCRIRPPEKHTESACG